jgi:hypothetical protein
LVFYAHIRHSLSVHLSAPAPELRTTEDLDTALGRLRAVLGSATFPIDLPTADAARDGTRTLAGQLDDYLIPRLRHTEAPLLAVVGGSTGAGKSTLVNSLVRSPVSAAGVLRPTTRGPVLVCHPADGTWFGERSLLSGLARSTRPGDAQLQVVSAPLLRPGLALLDAPDFNSVVAANRALAHELLAAADLWLFVTTAVRYADAVPWAVLRSARDRGTVVAIVLDRVPPEARDEIVAHFAQMLRDQGLAPAPLFVVAESTLDGHGLLAELDVAAIKTWLDTVASSSVRRRDVTRRTLLGAVSAAAIRTEELAQAANDQARAVGSLAAITRDAYGRAMSDVEAQVRAGAVLRGESYARWQEADSTGELPRALRIAEEPRRAKPGKDTLTPATGLQAAIAEALAALIVDADLAAADDTGTRWRTERAGRELLAADPVLGRPSPGFVDAAFDLVHGWQQWLAAHVRAEAPSVRTRTRAYGTGAAVLLATIAAVAPPPGEEAGAELQAIRENPAVMALGERARAEFLVRVGDLLAAEVDRRLSAIGQLGVDPGLARRLLDSAQALGATRHVELAMSEAA